MTRNNDLVDALEEAAIWGMTLVLCHGFLKMAEDTGVKRNHFHIDRNLATPATRVTGMNVDTLQGFAWVDLADGPQVLDVADTNDRYYTVQLVDAYLQNIAYIGRRTTGTSAGKYLLTGPGWSGETPDGMPWIELPTNLVFARLLMQVSDAQDPMDMVVVRQLMEGFILGSLAEYPEGRIAPLLEEDANHNRFLVQDLVGMGAAYFDRLCDALLTQPPSPTEMAQLERFIRLGIGPGLQPSKNPELAPSLQEALNEAVAEVRALDPLSPLGDGPWMTNSTIRDVGPLDPKLRARMCIDAPGYHAAVEAIYAALVTAANGSVLTGENAYRLHFPPGGIPPVGAFWSMTMYALPEWRFVENPIDRYAIGSNFETLEYGEDGSLDILLQQERPESGDSNWLPTPSGQFMLLCRFYQPGPDVINGKYNLPNAVQV